MNTHLLPYCVLLLYAPLLGLLHCAACSGQSIEARESDSLETSFPVADSQVDQQQAAQLIVQQTNRFRESNDLQPLQVNAQLAETAQYFANYMARTDQYGHHADDNRPAGRAENHGYDYCLIAENIAYLYSSTGFSTSEMAEEFVEGWKDSPQHRENMLSAAHQETGVAVARSDKSGHWYAVQMFGRPQSASIKFSLENRSESVVQYNVGERLFELPPQYKRTHIRCREVAVDFQTESLGTTAPSDGQAYTIVEQQGQLAIEREN